jgi:hypothetical protein
MKRLIVKYNRVIRREEMDKIETKVQKEWKEREAVILPECCDYEIIDDGVNEAAIWLDQEIEKRKAAVEEFCKNLNEEFDEVDQFVCSECDIRLEGWHRIDYDEGEKEYFEYTLKYCPNCGRKIRSTQ